MNYNFRSQLINSNISLPIGEKPQSVWTSIWHLHLKMFEINAASKFYHKYESPWYEWPLLQRGVGYWWKVIPSENLAVHITLFGNPLLYWLTFLVVIYETGYLIGLVYREESLSEIEKRFAMIGSYLLFGYAVNLLPYLFITRTCFMYHYHPSLYFGILLDALLVDRVFRNYKSQSSAVKKKKLILSALLLGVCLLSYLYFMPYSFGIPMTMEDFERKKWLSTWEDN